MSQAQDDKEGIIGYTAKSLTKSLRNYSTPCKELLALVWGMEHFELYQIGRKFTARTAHSA